MERAEPEKKAELKGFGRNVKSVHISEDLK